MNNKKSDDKLTVVDEIMIEEDASVTGWLCALLEINLSDEKRGKCPAPSGGCPRGFSDTFQCESLRSH